MPSAGLLRFDTPPARLRAVAFLEGLSYLVLLGVAMPLKYLAGQPLAVRVVGSLHGALFIALALFVLLGLSRRKKPFRWGVRIGIASLVPFGTFFLDRELREDDERWRAERASSRARA
jgi:integral membrane protein